MLRELGRRAWEGQESNKGSEMELEREGAQGRGGARERVSRRSGDPRGRRRGQNYFLLKKKTG